MAKAVHVRMSTGTAEDTTLLNFEDVPRVGEGIAVPKLDGSTTVAEVTEVLHVPAEIDNNMPAFTVVNVVDKSAERRLSPETPKAGGPADADGQP